MSIKISPVKMNIYQSPKITFEGNKTSTKEKDRNMGKLLVSSILAGTAVVAGFFLVKVKLAPRVK